MLAHQGDIVPVVMVADRLVAAGDVRWFREPAQVAMLQGMLFVVGPVAAVLFTQGGSVKKLPRLSRKMC